MLRLSAQPPIIASMAASSLHHMLMHNIYLTLQFWTYRRRTSEKAKADARRLLDGDEDA